MGARTAAKSINGREVRKFSANTDELKSNSGLKIRVCNRWVVAGGNNSTGTPSYAKEQSRLTTLPPEHGKPAVPAFNYSTPNPVEHLLHVLASCLATAMIYKAAARGIEIQEVESSLEGNLDLRGFLELDENIRQGYQGIRVHFKIKADVPDERVQEIGQLGPAHSPVFDSLTHGVPVAVTVERL